MSPSLPQPQLPLAVASLAEAAAAARTLLGLLPDTAVMVVDDALVIRVMQGEIFGQNGLRPEALLGRSVGEALPAERWQAARPHFEAALLGETRELHWQVPPHSEFWARFAPLTIGGSAPERAAILVARDVSVERAALAQAERRAVQQAAVAHLGTMLLGGARFADLAEAAAVALTTGLRAITGAVLEEVPEGGLRVCASHGEPLPPPPPVAPRRRQVFEFVRDSGQPLVIDDLAEETVLCAPALQGAGMVSLVVAPVATQEVRFGVVGACSREKRAFSADDLAFLQSVGNVVAQCVERDRHRQRMAEANARTADFWELSLDLLAVFSADGRFLEASASWERILGWAPAELLGRRVAEFVHPEDQIARAAAVEGQATRTTDDVIIRLRARTGAYRWLLWSVRESLTGTLYSTAKDVTDRHEAEAEIERREAMLNQAERLAALGSWQMPDFESDEVRISPNMAAMFNLDEERATIDALLARTHPDERAGLRDVIAGLREGRDPGPIEFRVVRPDGCVRTFSSRFELILGTSGLPVGMRGTTHDVTERRDTEMRLRNSEDRFRQGFDHAPIAMSLIDAKTGRYVRVNAAFCDLVARTEEDVLGLTFAQVLHPDDVDRAERRLLAEGGKDALVLEKRYRRPDGSIVWGSIHVSRVIHDEGGVDVLFVQTVDVSERHAQEDSLRRHLSEVAWIGEIRAALAEDRFELHAQPIVDIATGEAVHFELLLRMRDAEGQLVPPDAFLPTAERYGDIRDIDRWVLGRGLELAAGGMSVGINLSGSTLDDPGLIHYIDEQLARTGADPANVVFEITETALVKNAAVANELGTDLRARGCRFALDDFGTGYGGFHYLKTLSLDVLKIDREFVRDLVSTESDRHLIWATVNLAKAFGLTTVAEGVEDQATLDLLREMGVDQAQGYHLGRPAPVVPGGPS